MMIHLQRFVVFCVLAASVSWLAVRLAGQADMATMEAVDGSPVAIELPPLDPLPERPEPDPAVLNGTLARPLFLPDRRPPSVQVEVGPTAPVATDEFNYVLSGVIRLGALNYVILHSSAGETLQMVEGDMVAGWRLADVSENTARFIKGEESRTLAIGE